MYLIVIDRVSLVLLTPNLAEIARMKPFLAGIPVLKRPIRLGEITVIEIARVKGIVEGGGRNPVQHHEPHGQYIDIPHQQHITQAALTPLGVEEALELFGVIHTVRALENALQRPQLRRQECLLVSNILL